MRGLAAITVLLAAAPVYADDYEVSDVGFRFELPDGFQQNQDIAPKIVHDFHDPTGMLALPYKAGGLIFTRDKPRTAVYALWRVTDAPVANVPSLVRAEIDDFWARPAANRLIANTEKVRDKLALARLEYKPLAETHVVAQAALFVDAHGRVHEARLECLFPAEEIAEVRAECDKVMASFGLVVPDAELQALGPVPPRARHVTPPPDTSDMTLTTGGAKPPQPVGPIVLPPEPSSSTAITRLLLWGGVGLVILAVGIVLGYRRVHKP